MSAFVAFALLARISVTEPSRVALGVRLVGGGSENEGRVEIYRYGYGWGTICDDLWGDSDAQVVCAMLGYDTGVAYGNSIFGEGFGDIFMDNVRCDGYETSLWDCPRNDWGDNDCGDGEDAGVLCGYSANVPSTDGQVRIVNYLNPTEGRVGIFYDGEWGSVCYNGWTNSESRIVCRDLGFEDGEAVAAAGYPRGTGRMYDGFLQCHGNESSLLECPLPLRPHTGCGHDEEVAVRCRKGPGIIHGIRLRGGQHYMEGRVEIFVRDRWGTVCDDTYDDSWDDADAKVVCRMLGFGEHGSAARRHTFRHGTGHVWLNGLDCRGDEISLEQCENVRWGGKNCGRQDLDAGVRCLPLEH